MCEFVCVCLCMCVSVHVCVCVCSADPCCECSHLPLHAYIVCMRVQACVCMCGLLNNFTMFYIRSLAVILFV